jgi:hypothetical protein
MKNQLIGALVASIILFMWQFLSWALLNIHGSEMSYTPNQDAIMEVLSANLEEGQYYMPRLPDTASNEEQQAAMEAALGKPWAIVSYHASMSNDMGMNMLRGWVIDFVAAFLLCWLLLQMANLDFKTCLLASLAVGLIGYFTIDYLNSIWFDSNSLASLLDAVVQWGICGAWLGWWLPGRA